MNFIYDILNKIVSLIYGTKQDNDDVDVVLPPESGPVNSNLTHFPVFDTGRRIDTIPGFRENIVFYTLHQGLGNYMFFTSEIRTFDPVRKCTTFDNPNPIIKIELRRLSWSYVGVLLGDRELIWDICQGSVYTDDNNDVNYWHDTYKPLLVYGTQEFSIKSGEILAI